jgi:hypothetical protein
VATTAAAGDDGFCHVERCPPASPPWATITSTPDAATARVVHRGDHGHDERAGAVAAFDHRRVGVAEPDAPHRHLLLEDRVEGLGNDIGERRRRRRYFGQLEPAAEAIQHLLHGSQRLAGDLRRGVRRSQIVVQPQVDAEGTIGQLAHAADLAAQIVGAEPETREDAERTGVRHFRDELGARDATHAGLENRMIDAQQIAERSSHGSVSLNPFCYHPLCASRAIS